MELDSQEHLAALAPLDLPYRLRVIDDGSDATLDGAHLYVRRAEPKQMMRALVALYCDRGVRDSLQEKKHLSYEYGSTDDKDIRVTLIKGTAHDVV
jgi:hypothetical protein